MELQALKATTREAGGTDRARRVRKGGTVPAILYGGGGKPVCLGVDLRDFQRLVQGKGAEHAVVQLEVDDKPQLSSPALLKAVQHHPLRGDVLHVDFQRIRLDEKITTMVPIVITGQATGVVEGGVLDRPLRELEVECLAADTPEQIEVDVSELDIGDSVHVADIAVPADVTIVTDTQRTIAAVLAPRIVREVVAAEAAEEGEEEAAEPAEKAEEGEEEKAPARPYER